MIKTESYGAFSSALYDKTFLAKVPSHGHFELTFRCALKCGFCYCTCYTDTSHTQHELSTQEVLRILTEAAEGGCLWITFSGGDPFIRKDFRQIYDHALSLGMIVSIFCSGLILTDEWLDHLCNTRPLKIELPFYGITESTYDAVAGKKGAFPLALQNIKRMTQRGLPVKLKTKITKKNVHEAESIKNFVEEKLGLEFSPNYYLYPRLDGSTDGVEDRLSPLEIKKLEEKFQFEGCGSSTSNQAISMDEEIDNPAAFRCAAGINSFYVNPYGELNFCTYVRESSFDLRKGGIAEGVALLRSSLLTKQYSIGSSCRTCAIQASCQNCPGHAVLETGSLLGKSDYLCEVNHLQNNLEWKQE